MFDSRCRSTTIPIIEFGKSVKENTIENSEKSGIIKEEKKTIEKTNYKKADEELIRQYEDKTFKLFGYEAGDGILTKEEVESLKLYTADEYDKINKFLRGEIKEDLAYAKYEQKYYSLSETSARIKNILKNNHLDDDLVLYRGVNKEEFTALKKAKEFKSLKSTTFDEKVMEEFSEEAKEKYSLEKEYKVIINAPKGTQGVYINSKGAYEDEREFLINAGQKYKVIKEEETTLYLEVLKNEIKW